jgi:hypothetical protein
MLRFQCAETDEVCCEFLAEFPEAGDPLGVYTVIAPLPVFAISRAGRYLFQAIHDGMEFAVSPVEVKVPEEPDGIKP